MQASEDFESMQKRHALEVESVLTRHQKEIDALLAIFVDRHSTLVSPAHTLE